MYKGMTIEIGVQMSAIVVLCGFFLGDSVNLHIGFQFSCYASCQVSAIHFCHEACLHASQDVVHGNLGSAFEPYVGVNVVLTELLVHRRVGHSQTKDFRLIIMVIDR